MNGFPDPVTRWLGKYHEHFDSIESTNKYLLDNHEKLPHGAAVTASVQTGGRGRLGRNWNSVKGKGLALSFLIKGYEPSGWAELPLVTGIAVSRALERACGEPAPIKWSNDVLLGDKKACGILCEGRIRDKGSIAVVGVGINLTHERKDFESLGLEYATSVKLVTGKNLDFKELYAHILGEIEQVLDDYEKKGFICFHEEYIRRCVTVGREIRIAPLSGEVNGSTLTGKAISVSEKGELICLIDGETRAVNSGEVSVRGLYGYI